MSRRKSNSQSPNLFGGKNSIAAIIISLIVALGGYGVYNKSANKAPKNKTEVRDDNQANNNEALPTPLIDALEIPVGKNEKEIVKHNGYTLSYNEEHEQANWVAYEFDARELNDKTGRKDDFRPDPDIKTGSATLQDYKGSGYDRGHLAPSADMRFSSAAQSDCFLLSNMSPQKHEFNAGNWEQLERKVRDWARGEGKIYVVTGPVLTDGPYKKIGRANQISVPKYFYKAILTYHNGTAEGIGFIMPHEGGSEPINRYAVSIDEVEKKTGIDFFPKLDDKIENRVESTFDMTIWF